MDLSTLPLFDHHCHPLDRPGGTLDARTFRAQFTESRDPALLDHVPETLFYRRAIRNLASFLGCAATESAVLVERNRDPSSHASRLLAAAGLSEALIDTGFRSRESLSLEEHPEWLGCAVREVLRLEQLAERLIPRARNFAAFEEAYRAALTDARARGIAAFKSILAYRGGLGVARRSATEAREGFIAVSRDARPDQPLRLECRPLLEYLLRVAMQSAAGQGLPVQFHTGFGDDESDLREANPLHLRPLLQDPSLCAAPVVLLHAWPYAREAGYLSALFGHVFVDLSLAIPFTAHGGEAAIRMALELAPTSKLLLATDAAALPERFYLGALCARQSLARALQSLYADGWLTITEADAAAGGVLHANAERLYG